MTNPANSDVQNLLPVQAYFSVDGTFQTFIGQGQPFYAIPNPDQSGLHITNSTIDSSVIGGTTPAAGTFTSMATTTGTIANQPVGATDIVNLLALQSYAAGISWKQPCAVATLTNITLSGLQTIDTYTTLAGDRVLVKDQSNNANNGIYIAASGAWSRALDANSWDELICAISFIEYGTQKGGAWFCTAQPGGTLGVTPLIWSQFTTSATYTAGTGLTLIGSQFSITNTGATAATYGSASRGIVQTVNAQGQITNIFDQDISIAVSQLNNLGTSVGTALTVSVGTAGSFVVNGGALGTPSSGTLTNCTFPTLNQNTTGYAAGLAGGAAGSLPYQTAANTTGFLPIGTDGYILSIASGVPVWIANTVGTVTSVSGTGTVNGLTLTGTVTTSGSLTLGGTLDLSSPPKIGNATANEGTFTTLIANTNLTTPVVKASNSAGLTLQNSGGTPQMQMGSGGGNNISLEVATNINPANAAVSISPTGTGTVTINPATASAMDNVSIGGTTPLAGTFTTLRVNSTISLAGSTGTAGYLMQSNGASAPTWVDPSGITVGNATNAKNTEITDDTTTATSVYPTWVTTTTGNLPQKTSSTKLSFVPSTGTLSATLFSGGWSGMPSGTAMVFRQTAAPTGWTKITSSDNAALRVVSGTAGTGGTVNFTTAFSGTATVDGTAITTAQMPAHNHGVTDPGHSHGFYDPAHRHSACSYNAGGGGYFYADWAGNNFFGVNGTTFGTAGGNYTGGGVQGASTGISTQNNGSGSTHTHATANFAVKYVDVIVATKD
jgi:hypothetical protein